MSRTQSPIKTPSLAILLRLLAATVTVFVTLVVFSQAASAAVWPATRQWDSQAESNYRAWIENSWDKNFFTQPGPLHGLKVDCAKAVYSARFVYSWMNQLPFVVNDPTGGSALISNEMSRFDSLAPKKRVRAFFLFLADMLDTHTLPNDTYPVAVSRDAIHGGTILVTDIHHHHSWTVKFLSDTGIPFLVFGSRPPVNVLYERFEYPSSDFLFPRGLSPEINAGFRAWRHPEDLKSPVWMVPGYSLDQYALGRDTWGDEMQKHLQLSQETNEGAVRRLLVEACRGFKERIESVNSSIAYVAKVGGRCMTRAEFDDYSTPSRDQRMKDTFAALEQAYNRTLRSGFSAAALAAQARSVIAQPGSEPLANAYCVLPIIGNQTMTLGEVRLRSNLNLLSSNPLDDPSARWGLEASPTGLARACPVY
jgi:hypothetical protein